MAIDRDVWASETITNVPVARPRLVAAASGLVHLTLALGALAIAVRLAVSDDAVACVEPDCVTTQVDAVMYGIGAYSIAFALWVAVLRRLLAVSVAGLRRLRTAMTIHLLVGGSVIAAGLALGGTFAQLGVLIAAQVVPTVVTYWAATPLVTTGPNAARSRVT